MWKIMYLHDKMTVSGDPATKTFNKDPRSAPTLNG